MSRDSRNSYTVFYTFTCEKKKVSIYSLDVSWSFWGVPSVFQTLWRTLERPWNLSVISMNPLVISSALWESICSSWEALKNHCFVKCRNNFQRDSFGLLRITKEHLKIPGSCWKSFKYDWIDLRNLWAF